MRLLIDPNLSHPLLTLLREELAGSVHVRDVGLRDAEDAALWAYATAASLAILTKDDDFVERSLLYGHPPKVIHVRTGNGPTTEVADLIRSCKAELEAFIADPRRGLLELA